MNGLIRRKADIYRFSLQNPVTHGSSAQAFLDAAGTPLLVLDRELTVTFANMAFRELFAVTAEQAVGRRLADLGGGSWDIPDLMLKLRAVIPEATPFKGLRIEGEFAGLGHRVLKLEARGIKSEGFDAAVDAAARIVLTVEDLTEAVAADRHKDLLVSEMAHRIKNSLSVIAAFVTVEISRGLAPCREGYRAMQTRLAAVASLYDMISRSSAFGPVDMRTYLKGIAGGLRAGFVGEGGNIQVAVDADPLKIDPNHAVSVGLLVNELATNAIKHAFPSAGGRIILGFRRHAGELALSVRDDGVGLDASPGQLENAGLGMRFVDAFVQQLRGTLTRESGSGGTSVTVRLPASILAE